MLSVGILDILFDKSFLATALAALFAFATIVTLGLPLAERDALGARLKSVARRREELRAKHHAALNAKCGSLREAIRMVHVARAHGLAVMVGCMIESSLAITAAAHFTPLVDIVDLDGAALLKDDPFVGATIANGQVRLPDAPGLGVTRR